MANCRKSITSKSHSPNPSAQRFKEPTYQELQAALHSPPPQVDDGFYTCRQWATKWKKSPSNIREYLNMATQQGLFEMEVRQQFVHTRIMSVRVYKWVGTKST
jgi:hypothetical protein